MTNPPTPNNQLPNQQFRSTQSGRLVVPGWMNTVPGKPDTIEIQFDLDATALRREQVSIVIEYWATPEEMTVQSLLPARAFTQAAADNTGWCVFVPAQGHVHVLALDPQPNPPVLSNYRINIDPETNPGTVVNVSIGFPDTPNPAQNLLLRS